jgi:putative redox protein
MATKRRLRGMPDVEVCATNIGPTAFAVKVRGHVVLADVPEARGGTDLGPRPAELFLASLAACFGMVVALHCRDRGLPYAGVKVWASGDKVGDPTHQQRWTNLKLHVRFPEELPPERIEAIMRHAKLACSVRGTISAGEQVEVSVCSGEGCPICKA